MGPSALAPTSRIGDLLGPADPLPHRPSRVLVNGTSGSGKTTLAARLAGALGLRHVEIDALYHGPGWVAREAFLDDVRAFAAGSSWVTEWQYSSARPVLLDRADLLVWLDLPVPTVMRQVTQRTISRRIRREVLWNGNREGPLRAVLTDPDHIVRWAWRTRHAAGLRVLEAAHTRPDLPVVRLRSRRDVHAWSTGPVAAVGP